MIDITRAVFSVRYFAVIDDELAMFSEYQLLTTAESPFEWRFDTFDPRVGLLRIDVTQFSGTDPTSSPCQ